MRRRHKYGAKQTLLDGIRFASKGEAGRYAELKLLERAGKISALLLQPRFPLRVRRIGSVADQPEIEVGTYVADFKYFENGKAWCTIEDYKGFDTPLGKLKRKLAEALYGIQIRIVRKTSWKPVQRKRQ